MKTRDNFGILMLFLIIAQILICNYFQFSPYVVLSILPAVMICVPLTIGNMGCMLLAFIGGLSVDWLSEGIIGLNAAALLPVAFARKGIIRIFLGEDIIARNDSFSLRRNGIMKVSAAMIAAISMFLMVYIFLDGAGTRPFWFNLSRFGISLACNLILAIIVTSQMMPDERR